MNIHNNARLTPIGRERIVMQEASGQTPQAAARAAGVCPRTIRKWVARYAVEGVAGLQDRSSRPKRLHRPTPSRHRPDRRVAAPAPDRQGDCPGDRRLAGNRQPGLEAVGLNRLSALEPATPVRRYEREHPGELIHLDIKKLGRFKRIGHRITGDRKGQSARGAGWEFVHVCIDDASRIALTRIMPDEKVVSAGAFLKAAVARIAALSLVARGAPR